MTNVGWYLDQLEDLRLEYGIEAEAEFAYQALEECLEGQIGFDNVDPEFGEITPVKFVNLCKRIIAKRNGEAP